MDAVTSGAPEIIFWWENCSTCSHPVSKYLAVKHSTSGTVLSIGQSWTFHDFLSFLLPRCCECRLGLLLNFVILKCVTSGEFLSQEGKLCLLCRAKQLHYFSMLFCG